MVRIAEPEDRYQALVALTMIVNAIRAKEEYIEPHRQDYHRECLKSYEESGGGLTHDHIPPVPQYGNAVNLFDEGRGLVMALPVHYEAQMLVNAEQITDRLNLVIWRHLRNYVLPESNEPRLEGLKTLFYNHINWLEDQYSE
jgi:hypothetical protein